MLLNTDICIAIKNICGEYIIKETTVFEIEDLVKKFNELEVKISKNKDIMLKVKCPVCGKVHHYSYNINELLKREMLIGGCEEIGVPIFYMGKTKSVTKRIEKYIEVNKKIYAML